ncbi:cation diffusion facilitator family transporter [Macrococcus hajekii]|uniref:Cation diffusion facilitator family transporter n=1 Tax=Macrococcus hajekii TaxID=198482 RepID=A0A4R6BPG2_9STAP|nr:cation diffusion facilitator family transporter [Macrococcus hajekii]TDM03567.1 cation diffusion facilitator family transporter [Macrococcus hajekii]GGB06277.1 cation diffusion facilitator transporter [Macrococcus hajekii]
MTGLFALLKKGSKSSLMAAIVNFILGLLKFGAYVVTGNVAMFAEMMHSFGDAANQLFVWVGSAVSRKKPNEKFPFGYGRLVNIVCLFAVIIVAILAYETILEGIHHIQHPASGDENFNHFLINAGVLLIGIVLESSVLYKAGKEVLEEAHLPTTGIHPFTTSYANLKKAKPATKLVFLEDTVATGGGVLALLAIIIARLTGFGQIEGIVSVVIGLMMFYVVARVFLENAAGAIGVSDQEMEVQASRIILENDHVTDIKRLTVLKEGEDLHLEALLETPHADYNLRQLSEIKKDIAYKLLEQPHVVDVNLEFMEADDVHDWKDGQGSSTYRMYSEENR